MMFILLAVICLAVPSLYAGEKTDSTEFKLCFEAEANGKIAERNKKIKCTVNSMGKVQGKDGVILFPGQVGDYIQVYKCPVLNFKKSFVLETEFQIEKFSDNSKKRVMMILKAQAYYISFDSRSIEFGLYGVKYEGGSRFQFDAPLEMGKWYKLKFVYNGLEAKLFVNDKLVGKREASGIIKTSPHYLYIGGFRGNSVYNKAFAGKMKYLKLGEIYPTGKSLTEN